MIIKFLLVVTGIISLLSSFFVLASYVHRKRHGVNDTNTAGTGVGVVFVSFCMMFMIVMEFFSSEPSFAPALTISSFIVVWTLLLMRKIVKSNKRAIVEGEIGICEKWAEVYGFKLVNHYPYFVYQIALNHIHFRRWENDSLDRYDIYCQRISEDGNSWLYTIQKHSVHYSNTVYSMEMRSHLPPSQWLPKLQEMLVGAKFKVLRMNRDEACGELHSLFNKDVEKSHLLDMEEDVFIEKPVSVDQIQFVAEGVGSL